MGGAWAVYRVKEDERGLGKSIIAFCRWFGLSGLFALGGGDLKKLDLGQGILQLGCSVLETGSTENSRSPGLQAQ